MCEGIPRCHGLALLGTLGDVMVDTKKVHKRTLSPQDVQQFLGIVEIHPVKFDGKVWVLGAGRRSGASLVYARAKVESLDMKVEENMMSLKFRTWMSGSGTPSPKDHIDRMCSEFWNDIENAVSASRANQHPIEE